MGKKKGKSFFLKKNNYTKKIINESPTFDLIVNLNSTPIAKEFLINLKSEKKIGFGSNDSVWENYIFSFIKSRKLSTINLVDLYRNIFSNKKIPFKIKDKNFPSLNSLNKICFQLASRNIKRQWPLEYFAEIADFFSEKDIEIILIGSKNETIFSDKFLKKVKSPDKIKNLVGKTSLDEVFKIIDKSDLLITGDTGPQHIAAFYQTPILSIFTGPAYPFETLAYSQNVRLIFPFETKCYPCSEHENCFNNLICQKSIKPQKIIDFFTDKEANSFYKPAFDNIGQYLIPMKKTEINSEQFIAFLYRNFAKFYFFNDKISYNIPRNYIFKKKEELLPELHRELKITKKLISKNYNFQEIPELKYLKPIFYMKLLTKDFTLVNEIITYFQNL